MIQKRLDEIRDDLLGVCGKNKKKWMDTHHSQIFLMELIKQIVEQPGFSDHHFSRIAMKERTTNFACYHAVRDD